MAKSVPYLRYFRRLTPLPLALVAIALCGCSINLGSLSPSGDDDAPKAAPTGASVADAQSHNIRGQALARSGKNEQALAEFDQAIAIDPNNADALYNRGLLYQADKQHQSAIDDFTAASGLTPQRAEPLLGRAISRLALDRVREAAADLDEAAQADPQNAQVWVTRGQAYERLGDKTKAAGSYGMKHGSRRRQHVLGDRSVFSHRGPGRFGMQNQRRQKRRQRNVSRRRRTAGVVGINSIRVQRPCLC
jgi:tetratricopeptide (TPR) repeat protein